MRRYFDAARRVIEHHGGTVEKFIGDAVMAVFGVPVLHEDDALRAVRAAVALRDAVAALNVDLQRDYATTVTLRTGINTGEVVTGTDERLATGDAVNVAARLEQVAAPGEIVIGPETWRLVRDAVRVDATGPLELKGKSAPLTAYRLLEVRADPVGRPGRVDAPLVGRDNYLRMLTNAFANVVRERACNLFTILGTAGVGKSRLTAEFLQTVDATLLRGRCLSYGDGITYFPVVSMVKQLLHSAAASAAANLLRRDEKVAAAISVLLGEQDAVTIPSEIAWAVRKTFESATDVKPLVVVFDDLHWAEPALLELIEHIADLSRDAAILLIILARPELLDRHPGWGGGKLNATTVLLEPLNMSDSNVLIDALLADDQRVDPQLLERVRVAASGNPLFVEEMVAMVQATTTGDLIVPPTIQALLAARLDQLGPDERAVLERGSVEGQSFHRGAVQVMAPDQHDVAGKLMTLVRKDLVRPDRPVFSGEDAFKFRHLLIRDAAYNSLSKAERSELHERFAGWLLQHGNELVEVDEIAGYHLEQAYRYRADLGPVDDNGRRIAADAAMHLNAAGRRALGRGDVSAAEKLIERSDLLIPDQHLDVTVEEGLVHGLGEMGRLNDAVSRAERIAERCATAGDYIGELRARLAGGTWRTNVDPPYITQLRALAERARPLIEETGDHAALATLEFAAGFIAHMQCRFEVGLAAVTRAMDHAQRIDEPWVARPARTLATAAVGAGPTRIDDAIRRLDEYRTTSAALQPDIGFWQAILLAQVGRFDEARQRVARMVDEANERGLVIWVALSTEPAWHIEALAGDDAAAERAAREGCERLDALGERGWLSTRACQLAESLYALGRYAESEKWVARGLELGSAEDVLTQVLGLQMRSKLSVRQGAAAEALRLAEQAERLAGTTEAPVTQGDAALNRSEVLYAADDPAAGGEALQRAIAHYERKGATACIAHAQRLAAMWRTPHG